MEGENREERKNHMPQNKPKSTKTQRLIWRTASMCTCMCGSCPHGM